MMSDQFNWQIDEGGDQSAFDGPDPRPNDKRRWDFWVGTAVLLCLLIAGWGITRHQLDRGQTDLRQQVQTLLDLEQKAFLARDGDLFFSAQAQDAGWFSDQLRPETQALYRAGLTVTNVQLVEDTIWANVTWQEGLDNYQRVMFFQMNNGRLQHIPHAPAYWGRPFRLETNWGALAYSEMDNGWSEEISLFAGQVISDVCAAGCLEDRLPLTIVLATDAGQTADPNRLHIPSPRLLALDIAGQPADLFWQTVRRRIETHLTPVTVRFAVPSPADQLLEYEPAAQEFMALHPHIQIELITIDTERIRLNSRPGFHLGKYDAAELLVYDGAAFPLTEEMLASGAVYDLTDFVRSDPDFDQADFYEQVWQGAWWHGRMWFVPQAGAMNVLYYDKTAYQLAEHPEPSLRWTWDEMAQDMIIVSNPGAQYQPNWGFLDLSSDALFSYAYNWENNCQEAIAVHCNHPLEPQAVAAALEWYRQMSGEPGQMPDLTQVAKSERENLQLTWQSARRQAAIWVDAPIDYEFKLLLDPMGVVPFPGSDRFDGITPLWVQGHFISQQAENPQAVWEWLKFLSYQPPNSQFRYIPARPSVAMETRFWQILPRDLANVMRTAFPFTRPVTLEEQRYFTWEEITAVLSGETTPTQAANSQPDLVWFEP
ncbi:MAG: extracellular solute-binding protein [Chloroflexi bacterium]|nr:extracellular solute-binding protein [Chloroflexota bacterium]